MLYVFSTCRHFIRTVPSLCYDQADVEDVDTRSEDHIYDELRYVCMKNPIAPRASGRLPGRAYDPLETEEERRRAAEALCAKYAPGLDSAGEIRKSLPAMGALELTIEHLTGKEAIELHRQRGQG